MTENSDDGPGGHAEVAAASESAVVERGPFPEPGSAPAPAPAPGPASPVVRKRGWLWRLFNWFWRGQGFLELRKSAQERSPRVAELLRRARLTMEVAERTLEPRQRFASGGPDALVCELYRQTIFWALRAHAQGRTGMDPTSHDLRDLWSSSDPELLLGAADDEGALQSLRDDLLDKDFSSFAELSPEEQGRRARALRPFVEGLIRRLEAPIEAQDTLWLQRVLRMGALLAFLGVIVIMSLSARDWLEQRRDLARGKPWTSSSVYPVGGCRSPLQICEESPYFFFHTLEEENAWVSIDLGEPRVFTAIRVVNRRDCCWERALPLIVEVSDDGKTWREIARRTEEFRSWLAKLSPVRARWVRLRTPQRTTLHLAEVRILR